MLKFANFGEGGISKHFCLDVLVPVQRVQRADGRTRTLTCSLRVITQALQGVAQECKSRISKPFSILRVAACCTVLCSRWYQSGIRRSDKLQSDVRSNGTDARPSEPQSADSCFWALLSVTESAYLSRFLFWGLLTVSGCCALSGVNQSGHERWHGESERPLPTAFPYTLSRT